MPNRIKSHRKRQAAIARRQEWYDTHIVANKPDRRKFHTVIDGLKHKFYHRPSSPRG